MVNQAHKSRQVGDDIEVTAEMKDAGMDAYEEWRADGGEEDGTTGKLAVARPIRCDTADCFKMCF